MWGAFVPLEMSTHFRASRCLSKYSDQQDSHFVFLPLKNSDQTCWKWIILFIVSISFLGPQLKAKEGAPGERKCLSHNFATSSGSKDGSRNGSSGNSRSKNPVEKPAYLHKLWWYHLWHTRSNSNQYSRKQGFTRKITRAQWTNHLPGKKSGLRKSHHGGRICPSDW